MSWPDLIAFCIAAGGPVHVRAAAERAGRPLRTVVRRMAREEWPVPFPGVIVPPGTVMRGRAWAAAAVTYATGGPPPSSASRPLVGLTRNSALAHLGLLRSYPTQVEVALGPTRGLRPTPRFRPVRSSLLTPGDLRDHDGLPVVVGAALVRDLAPTRDRESLRSVVIDLAQSQWVDVDTLPDWIDTQPRFAGKALLRQVVNDLTGAGRTDSSFEFEVRARLRDAGIPLDRGQVPVPGRKLHLDLGIYAICFGIELAGFAYHRSRSDLERDARRINSLATLDDDWRVLTGTWDVLGSGFATFEAQVREVIAAQSRRHLGVAWPRPGDLRR